MPSSFLLASISGQTRGAESRCMKLSCDCVGVLPPPPPPPPPPPVVLLLEVVGDVQCVNRYVASVMLVGYLSVFMAVELDSSFQSAAYRTVHAFSTNIMARKRCSTSDLVTCGSSFNSKEYKPLLSNTWVSLDKWTRSVDASKRRKYSSTVSSDFCLKV